MDEQLHTLYEQVFEKIDIGVRIINRDEEPVIYNRKMRNIEEMTTADFAGRSLLDVFQFKSEQESRLLRALHHGESTKKPKTNVFNSRGLEITTMNHVYPIYHNEHIIGAVELANDITRMEKMLRDKRTNEHASHYQFADMIGSSQSFQAVIEQAKRASRTSSTVLLIGETGTGKELFAQSIHSASRRSHEPFVTQNCAALPESLIEGILFGTSKGAFTGALDRPGLFEQADGGTLLLDEINSLPVHLQPKLLRVIQEQKVTRIGESKERTIDVRLLATMNEDPIDAVSDGRLRKDLFYRLSVVSLFIPSLKERKDDIIPLSTFFLKKYRERFNVSMHTLSREVMESLRDYHWPGNVRELEHVIEGALNVVNGEETMTLHHLPHHLSHHTQPVHALHHSPLQETETLPERLLKVEQQLIAEAMDIEQHNISRAAKRLA
ncbi:LOW QUALITY PROTEIN: arginine utilization regulatory protein RocR [Geomicrobium sp. JCM 19055]|nr:LOW QUALITY PROTEIN: arginine utilization regulatory protein RocR [Geomicrobium sp. JCM 19055]